MTNSFAAYLTLSLALMLSAATTVTAHAKLLRSQPADGETLRQPPATIELVFSAELQDVSMNSISVTDQNGTRVDKTIVVISEDGKRMQTDLIDLSDGMYTVEWRALSADDHAMNGKFTFTLLPRENQITAPVTPPAPPTNEMLMDHQMPARESATNWAQSAVRWLLYLAMMTLFGGFVFRQSVLKSSLQEAPDLTDEERALGFRQGEDRFVRLTWLSLALLAVSAVAGLILQTSAVLGLSIAQAFAPSNLHQVLTETAYGPPWLLQIALTIAISVVVFLISRRREKAGRDALKGNATALWTGLLLGAMVLFLTPSLTGHARAAAGEYPLAIFADWLHLVGGGIWVGGLFHLALTMPRGIAHLQGSQRLGVISRVIPLFSRHAIAATILIVLTGIYNSWIHVDSLSDLWNTPYGQVLSMKIILFLPMIVLGGLNTFVLGPRAERLMATTATSVEREFSDRGFSRSVRVEAAIGVAVLLLAAVLAFLPPARQHEMPMTRGQSSANLPGNY